MKMSNGSGKELAELIYQIRCKCISRHEVIREKAGLSPAEFRTICALEPNDSITASVFADRVELSPSRSSRVIDKMVKHGYLIVEKNSSDKRQITISLAEKGLLLQNEVNSELNHCNEKLEESISEDDRIEIREALQKLLKAL